MLLTTSSAAINRSCYLFCAYIWFVCLWACAYVHVEVRDRGLSSIALHLNFLRQVLSFNLELINLARLADQLLLESYLSLLSHNWLLCKHRGSELRSSCLYSKHFYQLSRLPRPGSSVINEYCPQRQKHRTLEGSVSHTEGWKCDRTADMTLTLQTLGGSLLRESNSARLTDGSSVPFPPGFLSLGSLAGSLHSGLKPLSFSLLLHPRTKDQELWT